MVEEIPERVFAKLRRAKCEVDARELAGFGALASAPTVSVGAAGAVGAVGAVGAGDDMVASEGCAGVTVVNCCKVQVVPIEVIEAGSVVASESIS